jgi:uncharacterized RDD family membrane protein YckC
MDWYYLKDGRQFGPVPESSIRSWLGSGFLAPEDLVWHSGMPEWAPAGGQPEFTASHTQVSFPTPFAATVAPPAGYTAYAGFWLRAGAYIIDSLLLSMVLLLIWSPMLAHMEIDPKKLMVDPKLAAAGIALSWIYYATLESSKWQATLGKRAFRLKVTDMEGRRISFGRASLRQLSKLISGLLFYVGYVMAGFTPRKQGLHDMIAGCLVVRAEPTA